MLSCTLSAWTEIPGMVAEARQPLLLLCWVAHGCLALVLPVWFWLSLPGSGAPCSIPMPSRQLPGRQCLCTHRRADLWGSFQWLPLCCSSPWGFREGSLGAACASWPGLCVTPSAALEGWTRCQTCLAIDIAQDTFSAGTLLRGYERCTVWCSKGVQQLWWVCSELKWTLS